MVPRRLANEHVLKHLLDHLGSAKVADEVGAELRRTDAAERHVEAHDLVLIALLVDDRVQREVGVGGLLLVGKLDI